MEQGRGDDPPSWLAHWDGDGIIARIESKKIARVIVNSKLPTVDVSAGRHVPAIPWVETDDRAIAHLAANHFLERGFRHFAYCADKRFHWSRWRGDHFGKLLKAAGYRCQSFVPPSRQSDKQVAAIEGWLTRLPKPVGVFACYDIRGQQVLDACRNARVAVPDEVAVLGVDNDELLCELASPRLSSVIPDTHRTGYEAAALLARMMKGERLAALEVRIAPIGVHRRQSTDVLATDDPQVVHAVRFIREHACEPINVEDVLRAVPLSRKVLETRFKKILNHTLHDEIIRVRIDRAKQLLGHYRPCARRHRQSHWFRARRILERRIQARNGLYSCGLPGGPREPFACPPQDAIFPGVLIFCAGETISNSISPFCQ
jgi:LacI family transcriptional regulator